MTRTILTVTKEVDLDVRTAAMWFWGLSDEDQAQFLIEVEKISREDLRGSSADTQWYYMCGHLKSCECSNDETREMVRSWGAYVTEPHP